MDRLKQKHGSTRGRPTQLNSEEESLMIGRMKMMGSWGFPMTTRDLREYIKSYLDSRGVTSAVFKDNLPTIYFVRKFMNRHPTLSLRRANNIKRSRSKISHPTIHKFFNNLGPEIQNIPPSNIWNYDETNLRDEPGSPKAFFQKGVKYAERVINSTKSCTSIMYCGSADGKMLPLYVVYKAQNIYEGWCTGGPKGTRYNSSKSGWFDSFIFVDWFEHTALPVLRRQTGTKMLIGDNLASHISESVIQQCLKHDIRFVCLPPNSTDKLQPLDVGYFAPLKAAWKPILTKFKTSYPNLASIPKVVFPTLLKKLQTEMEKKPNILSPAFEKCGIYPLNRDKVLSRIPSIEQSEEICPHLDRSLMERIEQERFGKKGEDKAPRGKKIKIDAGKSYTNRDDLSEDDEEEEEEVDEVDEVDDEEEDEEEEEEDDETRIRRDEEADEESRTAFFADMNQAPSHYNSGAFVVARYNVDWFIAQENIIKFKH